MNNLIEKNIDRKEFLKIAGTGLSLFMLESLLTKVNADEILNNINKSVKRYAMVIDLRRCIGCEACTIACKIENNTPLNYSFNKEKNITWNEVIFKESGNYPDTKKRFWPRPCQHCENPPCVKVCPVNATYQDKERGLVLQHYDRCIGCKSCAVACPYGARYFNWTEPKWAEERKGAFNPDVELRYKGIIEKCTFCIHRIKKAELKAKQEEREIKDGEIIPACNLTCMGKARFFGDLNDKESIVSKLIKENSDRVYVLEEHFGTKPKVFYLKS
jgi:molybdopterin-containing oxidoreductase family iron-sulfur binding subunit